MVRWFNHGWETELLQFLSRRSPVSKFASLLESKLSFLLLIIGSLNKDINYYIWIDSVSTWLEIVYSLRYYIYEFWRQYSTVDINFLRQSSWHPLEILELKYNIVC